MTRLAGDVTLSRVEAQVALGLSYRVSDLA
jgi:hypothetical protein